MNFKELVADVSSRHNLPVSTLLRRCSISSAMFYFLQSGKRNASPRMEVRIANGLRVPLRRVRRALAMTRREAMLQ